METRTTEGKRIVDIRTSLLNGKMIKTTHYADGTKIVGIVSDAQITRLVDKIERIPDLKILKGERRQRGSGDALLFVIIAIVGLLFVTGTVKPGKLNDRCTEAGWFNEADCISYYSR